MAESVLVRGWEGVRMVLCVCVCVGERGVGVGGFLRVCGIISRRGDEANVWKGEL